MVSYRTMALLLCLFVLAWAAQAADICPGTVTSGTIVDISMPLSPKTPVWDSTTGEYPTGGLLLPQYANSRAVRAELLFASPQGTHFKADNTGCLVL